MDHFYFTDKPEGNQDIYWCSTSNKPVIIEYHDHHYYCQNCQSRFIIETANTHRFLGHVERRPPAPDEPVQHLLRIPYTRCGIHLFDTPHVTQYPRIATCWSCLFSWAWEHCILLKELRNES